MTEWGRDTPWRQGHLLTSETCKTLGLCHRDYPDRTLVVIATHDCDLAQLPEFEPIIEVIVGKIIEKFDGNLTHAKNSRRLHIEFNGDVPLLAEFVATDKQRIKKEILSDYLPCTENQFTPENYNIYQRWLASRYRRSAFPEEFERRLKETKLASKIAKTLEPLGANIAGIFFDIDGGEEIRRQGSDDPYTLDIYILYSAEPDLMAAAAAAIKAAEIIKQAFTEKLYNLTKTWQHIELRACDVVSETALTYHDFKRLKSWRLEHMSLSCDPQQQTLIE